MKKTYTDFSYQRKDSVIRIPEHIDDLIANGCNYVMYKNAAYSNRWFYAFIEKMEYINDGRTDVKIRTDCMQTWMFDITINPSFVEREHAASDEIGEHTIDEGIETGEYIVNNRYSLSTGDQLMIVVAVSKNASGEMETGYFYNGMTTGMTLMEISSTFKLPTYLSSDIEFGVLPFPMYDENQADVGYRSLQWGGYLCFPSYVSSTEMVGETVELLAYYSDDVNVAFYEKLLGKKVADAPDDRRMLELVWDSACSDFGQTYFSVIESTNFVYMLPEITKVGATEQLASYVAKRESTANRNFKKFLAKVK